MWGLATQLLKIILFFLPLLRAEDSLQSALNAVNRRQRDLSEYPRFGDFDGDRFEDNENVGFLTPNNFNYDGKTDMKTADLEQTLLDYLKARGLFDNEKEPNDRISSPFRERVENDKSIQREKMTEMLHNKLYNDYDEDIDDYSELMQRSYDKVRKNPENYEDTSNSYNNKRSYYNSLGWGSVGMKKRSRYFQPDGPSESLYLLNYAPRDEIFNRLEEEANNPDLEYNWNKYLRERKSMRYPFTNKRFPVTKRSSNYQSIPYQTELTHQHKRSPMKDVPKTDPKVEKELSNIFNPKPKRDKPKKTIVTKKPITSKPKRVDPKEDNTKEEMPSSVQVEKPLEIEKKSVVWSDYFGLDRRKKSSDDTDNEWLIERYHKAVAGVKRADNYPLKFFHDHEETKPENSRAPEKQNKSEETQINEMNDRLKSIEDSIVDDALKFTGAHEGAVDTKEIQSIKDKIISRLAAAYRLEKMRRALNEYKQSLEREKARNQLMGNNDDEIVKEEKRVSVPRKQALDEDKEKNTDEDNNIKCTDGDEECDEQNYRPPSEFLDQNIWYRGDCPRIEEACKEFSSVLGHYGRVFEIACNMLHMCLLCEDNSYYSLSRKCNILYMAKTDELCEADLDCQRVVRQAVKYLVHINRTIRSEPLVTCNLECPDKR